MGTYPRLVIAGTHSGVGKTTVTLALLAALRKRGRHVQPFKAGPDFIDPGHHTRASGQPSRNLDTWMLSPEQNRDIFCRDAGRADLSVIEGMMGLFDGSSATSNRGSTADVAALLHAPIVLVIDGSAMARSVAAMARGYAAFDPAVRVAAVLFNRITSPGHYRLLASAIESATDLECVGYLRPDPALTLPDRHLGLVTALEQDGTALYTALGDAAAQTVDLDRLEALATTAPPLSASPAQDHELHARTVRIGVAYDPAFCFYYQDNLDLLRCHGAECVRFSPLEDDRLPAVDLLYLGGGYPELHGAQLAANLGMRRAIRAFAEAGGPIYAECGGLMYLTEAIRDTEGRRHDMVGLFAAEAVMSKTTMRLGYRNVSVSRACLLGELGASVKGHEFHYSRLEPTGCLDYACSLTDVEGRSLSPDGLVAGHTLALYTHLHFSSRPEIARSLVTWARRLAGRRPGSSIQMEAPS